MPVPAKKALLKELDRLPYGQRCARLGKLGAAESSSPKLTALVAELEAGNAEEVCMALDLAAAAGLSEPLARGLSHLSLKVRFRAAKKAGGLLTRAQLVAVVPTLAPQTRRQLLKSLAGARRADVAPALFESISTQAGPREALPLLAELPEAEVARLLPEVGFAVSAWRTLAFRYPDTVLGHLRRELEHAPTQDRGRILAAHSAAVATLALRRPEALLQLVKELGEEDALPQAMVSRLPSLTRRFPKTVFELLTRPAAQPKLVHAGLPRPLVRELNNFDRAQVHALAKAMVVSPPALATLLKALPPSQREAAVLHAFDGSLPRFVPEVLLTLLPHARRDAEAQRMLALREVQDDRPTALRILAMRSIDAAREPLQQAAVAAKAEDRAVALALLVECTGRSRRGMTETLTFLGRVKNDQDPVRLAVVVALDRVPPSVYLPKDAPALSALVDWLVEARDTSHGTRHWIQQLAFRLMHHAAAQPEDPRFEWAFETLRKLAKQSGALALPWLERNLPRGAEEKICAQLLPLIRDASKRESHGLVLALARSLGRRAYGLSPLQSMLEKATHPSTDWAAQGAITLWLAPPRTRDARVKTLLARDESTVTVPAVFEHLHRRRQDWLDPFLEGRVLKGQFWKGKTAWVPPADRGFHRWLFRQQQVFAGLLLRIATDAARPVWERGSVISRLGQLETSTAATFQALLSSKDVAVVESALGSLAWLDSPEPILPTLLGHLESDRARVAMYAVPRVAQLVPGAVLAVALDGLLARETLRVTVRKEVLRLLGAHRSSRSLGLLERELKAPKVHPDVQIAVGHGARSLLDEEGAWPLLTQLATSPHPDVARSLLDASPRAVGPRFRVRYAALLLQVAAHPQVHVRKQAFSTLGAWAAGSEDAIAQAAAARVLDLAQGAEWKEAAAALAHAIRDGKAWRPTLALVQALVASPVTPEANARADRDLPARQRLLGLLQQVQSWPAPVRRARKDGLQALAGLVQVDRSLWGQRARLLVHAEDFAAPASTAEVIQALAGESKSEPGWAPTLADAVTQAMTGAIWETDAVLGLADQVVAAAPLVALALIAAAGRRTQWTEDSARRLRALRTHPSALVQESARNVATAVE